MSCRRELPWLNTLKNTLRRRAIKVKLARAEHKLTASSDHRLLDSSNKKKASLQHNYLSLLLTERCSLVCSFLQRWHSDKTDRGNTSGCARQSALFTQSLRVRSDNWLASCAKANWVNAAPDWKENVSCISLNWLLKARLTKTTLLCRSNSKPVKGATDMENISWNAGRTTQGSGICRVNEDSDDVIENRRITFLPGSISGKSGLNVFK